MYVHTQIHTQQATYKHIHIAICAHDNSKILLLDINECNNSPCQQNCSNTLGSFQCNCKTGYTADGTRCNGQWIAFCVNFIAAL